MSALAVSSDAVVDRLQSLKLVGEELRPEVRDLLAENVVLRQENADLRQQVRDLTREVGYWKSRHADGKNKHVLVQAELDQAKAETRQLKAERFGKTSEKQNKVDRSNDLADPQNPVDPEKSNTERKKRGQQPDRPAPKRRDLSHLPARVEVIDLPDEEKVCGCCGLPLTDLGCSKDSEQIEIEIELYRKQLERKRYRRTCNWVELPRTVTAPVPPKLLPKSIFGTSIWVYLLIEKFQLQRPTHRSIEQLRLLGLRLAPGTIADGFKRIEPPLTPDDARGVLVVDRYSGYKAMQQVKDGQLLLAFCWAHVRRDFVRIGKGFPELKDWALTWLRQIQQLYRLNRERLQHESGTTEFAAADALLRQHVDAMAAARGQKKGTRLISKSMSCVPFSSPPFHPPIPNQ